MAVDPPRRIPFGKSLSLERKLPLLMTGVLAVIMALSLVLTYGTLTRTEEGAARERMERAAREVASTVDGAAGLRAMELATVARDGAVLRALAGAVRAAAGDAAYSAADLALAREALERVHDVSDSGLTLELWDRDARRVSYVGADVSSAERPEPPLSDSIVFGPMYSAGGRVLFWAVVPIEQDRRRLGYLAQQRRVGGPPAAQHSLRELLGEDVTLYMRNASGDFWASAPGEATSPPLRRDFAAGGIVDVRPQIGRMIVAEAAVSRAPWVVVLESPMRAVHARARGTLVTLALLGAALIIVGAGLSWAISRRITRPLTALTAAAEGIARGEYARRVESAGARDARARDDEIGRLSSSFDQMATEIAASREELERRVEDAQAATQQAERANARLQEAIAEAERARADAEHANRAKSDFLAVMSHELRTPLNAIGGYAQLVEIGVYGPVTDEQREALGRLGRSQAHLLRLINDVLCFAKIDAGQVDYAIGSVPLGDALAELEPLIAPQLRAKRLTFTHPPCDPLLTVLADREKLQQIVLNLVTNAIKFTAAGGSVTLECDTLADMARVHVRDTGPGISAERLPAIFEPFVQGDRKLNRPHEGVGLGLAISRDLARGMGGDVTVQSLVGEGSVFTLSLRRQWSAAGDGWEERSDADLAHQPPATSR